MSRLKRVRSRGCGYARSKQRRLNRWPEPMAQLIHFGHQTTDRSDSLPEELSNGSTRPADLLIHWLKRPPDVEAPGVRPALSCSRERSVLRCIKFRHRAEK